MDTGKFTERKTGQVVRIVDRMTQWAFVPATLPPKGWQLPSSLNPLVNMAGKRLGKLDGIGRTLPNPNLLLRPLQARESIASSGIEGTYATPEELLLFVDNPRAPKSVNDPANSFLEVANYAKALQRGWDELGSKPISLNLIKTMHSLLLTGVRGKERDPGEFRRLQVCVGHDARYAPPPAQYLADLLDQLQSYMNLSDDQSDTDSLVRCFLAHYQFEAIHPFLDGNGRIGRALLALMVGVTQGHSMPWHYMSPYFERYRREYYDCLFRVSTHGEWTEWVEFCLRGSIEQANDAIARCEDLQELRRDYLKRVREDNTTRTHPLIEDLFSHPMITVTQHAKTASASYPTAKGDIDLLVKKGVLKQLPKHYPKTFYAPEIFAIAYREQSSIESAISDSRSTASLQPPLQSPSGERHSEPAPLPSPPSTPQAAQEQLRPDFVRQREAEAAGAPPKPWEEPE